MPGPTLGEECRNLWARVSAVAGAWSNDPTGPIQPGDFVATIGFASADYVAIDFVAAYLGLVSVPLQHNASALKSARSSQKPSHG